jgi:hypothetical protein
LLCRRSFDWRAGAGSVALQLKEVHRAAKPPATSAPPRPASQNTTLPLSSLWQELPAVTRLRALQALSRIVAQNLLAPPAKEVAHEQA